MEFIHGEVEVLQTVALMTGTSAAAGRTPPLFGRAASTVAALEIVLGVFLGVFERIDFNPRLASCLATPMGQELRGAVQRALEDHKALVPALREMRWELASYSRLAHAKYGHIAEICCVAGLIGVVGVTGHCMSRQVSPQNAELRMQSNALVHACSVVGGHMTG
ncbi:unnamed protein product [Durusdinium trenchii]|uniref:Uncharacterized protein n=1 Tax=Durusdinium trenchii TaxID=1381693 RepID=A0ABP0Q329_9DINO